MTPPWLRTLRRAVARLHTRGGQLAVAKQIGVSKQAVTRYLAGMDTPGPDVQAKIARLRRRRLTSV